MRFMPHHKKKISAITGYQSIRISFPKIQNLKKNPNFVLWNAY